MQCPPQRQRLQRIRRIARFGGGPGASLIQLRAGEVGLTWQSGTPLNDFGLNSYTRTTFLVPRGSAGRIAAIWDLNLRFAYPLKMAHGVSARTTLDWLHVGSARRAVWLDQLHYTAEDDGGNPINPNPTYGQVLRYQPPTQARLGVEFNF